MVPDLESTSWFIKLWMKTGRIGSRALGRARSLLRGSVLSEIWFVLILGLLVRASLWFYTSQADLSTFAEISQAFAYGYKPYSTLNIYPPGWNLTLDLIGRTVSAWIPPGRFLGGTSLAGSIGSLGIEPAAIVSPQYAIAEKSMLACFDVISGLLIVALARGLKIGTVSSKTLFALWFLNPLVITVSAVQGNYDVISTTTVLLALYLVSHRSWVSAGAATAIGGLFSIYPFFLLPLFFAFAIRSRAHQPLWKPPVYMSTGVGVALVATLWPPGVLTSFITDLTTGPNVGLNLAGFWVWSVLALPGFSLFRPELAYYSLLIVITCAIVTAASLLAIAASFLMGQSEPNVKLLMPYVGFSIIMGYTILPITQPQNILWILPFALFLAIEQRTATPIAVGLSILPSIFLWVGLGGALYLAQGFAVYTSILSPSVVSRSVTSAVSLQFIWFPLTEVLTFVVLILLADRFAWSIKREVNRAG